MIVVNSKSESIIRTAEDDLVSLEVALKQLDAIYNAVGNLMENIDELMLDKEISSTGLLDDIEKSVRLVDLAFKPVVSKIHNCHVELQQNVSELKDAIK